MCTPGYRRWNDRHWRLGKVEGWGAGWMMKNYLMGTMYIIGVRNTIKTQTLLQVRFQTPAIK